jgi:tetraacyldisaccharide 4'-kinase
MHDGIGMLTRLLEYFWYRVRPGHLILYPLSMVFGALAASRRALYRAGWLRSRHMPVPVVVVGNITVGGTGKTPLVLWLTDRLQERGRRPGIVTRGYGGVQRVREVTPDSDPAVAGDEPVLLARRSGVPVFAGRRRPEAAHALLAAHPDRDVIVTDDGLQHYALARDVEIAVVDAERGFGNGWLLPAGPLREPIARLRSVDAIVVNGEREAVAAGVPQFSMRLDGESFHNLLNPAFRKTPAELKGLPAHAIAGIGNPHRFFTRLQRMGLTFSAHPFPDHFPFEAGDLGFAGEKAVLMTEKDAVKCAAFARENWWFLPVEAEVDRALGELVLAKLESHAKLRATNGRQAA